MHSTFAYIIIQTPPNIARPLRRPVFELATGTRRNGVLVTYAGRKEAVSVLSTATPIQRVSKRLSLGNYTTLTSVSENTIYYMYMTQLVNGERRYNTR